MIDKSLSTLLKHEYVKSILFPLLLVEMMLLGAYFWSNAYVIKATQNTLIEEAEVHIQELSKRSAAIINNEFKTLSNMASLFQKEHENFFASYEPLHVNTKNRFYTQTETGIIFNTPKTENACSLFFSTAQKENPNRLAKAIATEKLDSFYNALLETNANISQVYFNSYDSMNRLCPFLPNVSETYSETISIPTFNFYYLADEAHNPGRNVVWTDAYLDPAGAGWMISAIAPVYKGDFLEGVIGIDVTIEHLIRNILSLELPYRSMSMIVDEHGSIIAMNEALEKYLGLKELKSHTYNAPIEKTITKPHNFNLFTNTTNPLARSLSRMLQANSSFTEFHDAQSNFLITQNTIRQTHWKFVLLLDKDSLLENSVKLKERTNRVGFIALGLMILLCAIFLFLLLRRAKHFSNQILSPLQALIEATKTFKDKLTATPMKRSSIAEINTLLENFTSMSHELQGLYDSMDKKIKEGVIEHMETQKMMLYQSRLAQMGEMISMIAHQWRQPLGSISAITASIKLKQSLKKFDLTQEQGRIDHEIFLMGAVGKIESYTHFLTTTIDDFRNFFRPEQQHEESALKTIIDRALGLIGKSLSVHKITLHVNNTSSHSLITYETQMMQVLINLLKNAQDAILEKKLENGIIWINAYEESSFFVIEIEDNAGGIPETIIPKLFDPYFSTKTERNGTGLGLYMSKIIVEEHCHGFLHVENSLNGAKFTIKIRGEHSAN